MVRTTNDEIGFALNMDETTTSESNHRVDAYSQSHTFPFLTRFSRMDSKALIFLFCLLFAAWLMSGTEALYGQNTDFNGRRSVTMVWLTLLNSLSSLTSVLITICQSMI